MPSDLCKKHHAHPHKRRVKTADADGKPFVTLVAGCVRCLNCMRFVKAFWVNSHVKRCWKARFARRVANGQPMPPVNQIVEMPGS